MNNYSLTTGLVYSTTGNISIDTTGGTCGIAGFCSATPPATLTLGTFNIRYGQEWQSLVVNITPNAGNVDVYILSETQVALSTTLSATTTKTIDLTQISQLANGAPLYVKLVFNGNAVVSGLTVSYTGNTVMAFPAPYQISLGNLRILYEVDAASLATLEIYDNRGRHVKTIFASQYSGASFIRSQNTATWDGKDEAGRTVNTGLYTIVIRVVPLDTSTGAEQYTSRFRILVIR